MRREIKFRCWDIQKHKYLVDNGDFYYIDHNHNLLKFSTVATRPDIYTIQQFTGLLDKNETLIFEGDIIDGAAVEYYTMYATFGTIKPRVGWRPLHSHFTLRYSPIVEGNNMQHPELLKE